MNVSSSPEVFWWKPACVLEVAGPDALGFLQGQFTNELRTLAPGEAAYGLWLTLKGKVLGDSFVVRGHGGSRYLVVSYASSAALLRERLESFIIADDVTIEDRTDTSVGLTVFREPQETASAFRSAAGEAALEFPGRRCRGPHLERVFPGALAVQVRALYSSADVVGSAEMARRRIRDGMPAIPADVGGNDLPNEAGLDADAISYTKGCYLGQEVMARLKNLGQVRRKLLRVAGPPQPTPAVPVPLFVGERQVGELRSAAAEADGCLIGLAMLSLLLIKPDAPLAFTANGTEALRLAQTP